MFDAFLNSLFPAAAPSQARPDERDVAPESFPSIEGVQHRVAVLRVRKGRIIEQSARTSG